jgi:undecaprenyl diphosphate synthase
MAPIVASIEIVYWPAFRELDFRRAIRTFQQRKRRFGR